MNLLFSFFGMFVVLSNASIWITSAHYDGMHHYPGYHHNRQHDPGHYSNHHHFYPNRHHHPCHRHGHGHCHHWSHVSSTTAIGIPTTTIPSTPKSIAIPNIPTTANLSQPTPIAIPNIPTTANLSQPPPIAIPNIQTSANLSQSTPIEIPNIPTTANLSQPTPIAIPNIPTTAIPNTTAAKPAPPTSTPVRPTPIPGSNPPSSEDIENCQRACPVSNTYQPVCGTNYVTYNSIDELICAQICGVDVRIYLRRTCPSLDVPTKNLINIPAGLTGAAANKYPTVQCIKTCIVSEENLPICGSDGITYDNPLMLLCAQMCGYDVRIKSMSACSGVKSTVSTVLTTTSLPYDKLCLDSCFSSGTEYVPVCGTNDITYRNINEMYCAVLCGVDVELKQSSPCSASSNNYGLNNNYPDNNDLNKLVSSTSTTTPQTTTNTSSTRNSKNNIKNELNYTTTEKSYLDVDERLG